MAALAAANMHWLATIDRLRPNTSAMTPEGTSNKKLVRWNTPSAKPISARENPRAASSATQDAPAICRLLMAVTAYSLRNCCLILNIKNPPFLTVFCKRKGTGHKFEKAGQKPRQTAASAFKKGALSPLKAKTLPFFSWMLAVFQNIRAPSFPIFCPRL